MCTLESGGEHMEQLSAEEIVLACARCQTQDLTAMNRLDQYAFAAVGLDVNE